MKGITLTQPWASAIALGYKRVETRSWRTSYRGPLLIHAAKGFPAEARAFAAEELALGRGVNPPPLSAIVAVANLVYIEQTETTALLVSGLERHYGDYSDGRYAWHLEDIRALPEPIPCRGALGLWTPPDEVIRVVLG